MDALEKCGSGRLGDIKFHRGDWSALYTSMNLRLVGNGLMYIISHTELILPKLESLYISLRVRFWGNEKEDAIARFGSNEMI